MAAQWSYSTPSELQRQRGEAPEMYVVLAGDTREEVEAAWREMRRTLGWDAD